MERYSKCVLPLYGVYQPRRGLHNRTFFRMAMKSDEDKRKEAKMNAQARGEVDEDGDDVMSGGACHGDESFQKLVKETQRTQASKRKNESEKEVDSTKGKKKTIQF